MSLSSLPAPVPVFLSALQNGDTAKLRSTLSETATLSDGSRTHTGDDLLAWLERHLLSDAGIGRPINGTRCKGEIVLTLSRDERDCAGAIINVEHQWTLTVGASEISSIDVERRPVPALPPAIAAYVRATNSHDLEALLATFDEDALVNDQLRDHRGKKAIREWARCEVIAERLTMYVVSAMEHHGHTIVTAQIDGEFDRRGLPDPLVLSFYFSASGDRIVLLIILRNGDDA